ncbi:MAG: transcriptional repressor [Armatimonadetes bacterium]|nr:transcriptional repressor [Armatimonadota bacterium]
MQTASTVHVTNSLEQQFRRHRKRLTPQRALICRLLDGNTQHPSAEILHRRARAVMPTLSLRTVYAILHELVHMGALQALDLGTGSTRYDPNPRCHYHAVCAGCGRVFDVDVPVGPIDLPPEVRQGFWVRGVDLIFRGMCRECRR